MHPILTYSLTVLLCFPTALVALPHPTPTSYALTITSLQPLKDGEIRARSPDEASHPNVLSIPQTTGIELDVVTVIRDNTPTVITFTVQHSHPLSVTPAPTSTTNHSLGDALRKIDLENAILDGSETWNKAIFSTRDTLGQAPRVLTAAAALGPHIRALAGLERKGEEKFSPDDVAPARLELRDPYRHQLLSKAPPSKTPSAQKQQSKKKPAKPNHTKIHHREATPSLAPRDPFNGTSENNNNHNEDPPSTVPGLLRSFNFNPKELLRPRDPTQNSPNQPQDSLPSRENDTSPTRTSTPLQATIIPEAPNAEHYLDVASPNEAESSSVTPLPPPAETTPPIRHRKREGSSDSEENEASPMFTGAVTPVATPMSSSSSSSLLTLAIYATAAPEVPDLEPYVEFLDSIKVKMTALIPQ